MSSFFRTTLLVSEARVSFVLLLLEEREDLLEVRRSRLQDSITICRVF
jgi:hypothetical protein